MKKNKAIFTNGYLYSIPDENAVKTETIQPGTQVKIARPPKRPKIIFIDCGIKISQKLKLDRFYFSHVKSKI